MCPPFISFPKSASAGLAVVNGEGWGRWGQIQAKDVANIFMIWNFVCDIALSATDNCFSESYFVVEVLQTEVPARNVSDVEKSTVYTYERERRKQFDSCSYRV